MHREQNTICTQYAAQDNTENNNMQHINNTEQNTENNTENTETEHTTQNTERTQNSAHNYRTYSFDLYHEYVAIKNSNTIELYTISK